MTVLFDAVGYKTLSVPRSSSRGICSSLEARPDDMTPDDTIAHVDWSVSRSVGRCSRVRTVTAMSRTRTVTGAGVIATLALVLLFGNQAVTEWVNRHTNGDSLWGWFLRIAHLAGLADLAQRLRERGTTHARAWTSARCSSSLFVAVILAMVSKSISGGGGAFFLGWAALVFASALAAFLTAFITTTRACSARSAPPTPVRRTDCSWAGSSASPPRPRRKPDPSRVYGPACAGRVRRDGSRSSGVRPG